MLVRREISADIEAIDAVHRAAFAPQAVAGTEPIEVLLVQDLRADAGWVPALSLVVEGPDEVVVGHVVCTVGAVGDTRAVGLGPIGVLPKYQRLGYGEALMHAVLAAADALDFPVAVLLGHLEYYPRFGFVPAADLGIVAPDPLWGEHFQARPLGTWTPEVAGPFRYAAPFDDL